MPINRSTTNININLQYENIASTKNNFGYITLNMNKIPISINDN